MTLEHIRQDIDRIDARILTLLAERMEKALLSKQFKTATFDASREQVVLNGVKARSSCLANPEFTEGLYRLILAESKAVQDKGLQTIGFQGVHGAYSDVAARAWMPGGASIPCHDFAKVFEGVQAGFLDYGIVPVENTLGGTVGQVSSILVTSRLRILGAVDMPVDHCLVAVPGQDHREIRYAYSHQQALSQCRRFLERNRLEGREWFDTAGAAKMVAEERIAGAAAVASRYAAELYGLEIIKEGIQDAPTNRTRFFILAKNDGEIVEAPLAPELAQSSEKCSVVFFTNDKAGALFNTLEIFAKAGINLTRIESVPYEPGDYAIFLDFDGSDSESKVTKAIEAASKITRDFRLLGCYRERKL